MALALFSFRLLDARTPYSHIAVMLVFMGVGLALTMSPLSNGVRGTLTKNKLGVGSGVFNLFKNVGGSVGVAIMGTLLDTRQLVHGATYRNYLDRGSHLVTSTLAALQNNFILDGMLPAAAKLLALSSLQGMVSQQAAVAAFDDVFLITAILCAAGILPALFIRDTKSQPAEEKSGKLPEQLPLPDSV